MTIVFYISGHGFGHATRDLEVIRHIHQQRPDARLIVRTQVPRWFLERSARVPIEIQPCETDTGVAQIDSLELDEVNTARAASEFYETFENRVRAEVSALTAAGATVVVGDVPPLAFAAAAQAGLPSIALANFTWDWIYAAYPVFQTASADALRIIAAAYGQTTLALRLPFAGGFETMGTIRDVPLVARCSRRSRDENRRLLQLDGRRPTVLASFGGHGAALPFEEVAANSDITLVVTDYEAAAAKGDSTLNGRLRRFSSEALAAADVRYEDLVSAADVVVSKPGYGIVSECIANESALLYTSRGTFAENDVLVAGMRPFLRSGFISQTALRQGDWEPSVATILVAAAPSERMRIDGARVAADAILDVVNQRGNAQ
jgi:UDP:flavonoid glycosyltransferase YjiC (YdhE family)